MEITVIKPTSEKFRAPRYKVQDELIVATKTIGTNLVYKLTVDNISRSGILLKTDKNHSLPFVEKTILELTIDPDSMWLPSPITCLASVVRKEKIIKDDKQQLYLGVRVIQIDNIDIEKWEKCLHVLATNAGKFVSSELYSIKTPSII